MVCLSLHPAARSAAIALLALVPVAADASYTKRNLESCKAALRDSVTEVAADAELYFQGVRGSVKQRLRFVIVSDDRRRKVTCEARRGKVIALSFEHDR